MKTTLIIGGTSGLGREIAEQLASDPNQTVLTASRRDTGPIDGNHFSCDITKDNNVRGMWMEVYNRLQQGGLQQLDRLVISVGAQLSGSFFREDWKKIERQNKLALSLQRLLYYWYERASTHQLMPLELVIVTSTTGARVRKDEAAYACSKASEATFGRNIAHELNALTGGNVLVVAVGGMRTAFWENTDQDTALFMDPAKVATLVLTAAQEAANHPFADHLRFLAEAYVPRPKDGSDPVLQWGPVAPH